MLTQSDRQPRLDTKEDRNDHLESAARAAEQALQSERATKILLKTLDRTVPRIKLEVMPLNVLKGLITGLWCGSLVAVLASLFCALAALAISAWGFGNDYSQLDSSVARSYGIALFAAEGTLRSIGALLIFFLLISYPQRIIVNAVRTKAWPLHEQLWAIVIIIVLSLAPFYSIWGFIDYWILFNDTVDFVNAAPANSSVILGTLYASLGEFYRGHAIEFQYFVSSVCSTLLLAYWGIIPWLQGRMATRMMEEYKKAASLDSESPPSVAAPAFSSTSSSSPPIPSTPPPGTQYLCCAPLKRERQRERSRRAMLGEDGLEEMVDAGEIAAASAYCQGPQDCQTVLVNTGALLRLGYARATATITRRTFGLPLCFAVLVLLYFVSSLAIQFSLTSQASLVPLVGAITVLRMCTVSNGTEYSSGFGMIGQSLIYLDSPYILLPSGNLCNPENVLIFRRAVCTAYLGALEIAVLVEIVRIARRTRIELQSVPYLKTRVAQLSFNYSETINFLSWVFIVIGGILATTITPLDFWIVERVSAPTYNDSSPTGNATVVVISPFYQVGVNQTMIGFGSFFLLASLWVAFMCFAYLPPDSYGPLGWFCGVSELTDMEMEMTHPTARTENGEQDAIEAGERQRMKAEMIRKRMKQDDYLFYLPTEASVAEVLDVRRKELMAKRLVREAAVRVKDMAREREKRQRLHVLVEERWPSPRGNGATTGVKTPEGGIATFATGETVTPAAEDAGNAPHIASTSRFPALFTTAQTSLPLFARLKQRFWDGETIDKSHQAVNQTPAEDRRDDDGNGEISLNTTTEPITSNGDASTSPKPRQLRMAPSSAPHPSRLRLIGSIQRLEETIADIDDTPPLVTQIRANIFVLETEILLYHFMHAAYAITELHPDTGKPLTWEEKADQIQDPRFRLVAHVESEETDTHVLVAVSADRIIISFRGTVSFENMKTDYDSKLVEHPFSSRVEPIHPPGTGPIARREANKPAYIHGGFLKAYGSVRERIRSLLARLSDLGNEASAEPPEDPLEIRRRRVVYITGHSLGGGLAVTCALDLAVHFAIPPWRIGLTTWGCPSVGTFALVQRLARVVPCSKRFVMAGDIITMLPFEPPGNKLTIGGVFRRRWYPAGTEILMDPTGNLLIRPSPMERFMLQAVLSGVSPHLRMSYCCSLMAFAVRSHSREEYVPDWWPAVISMLQLHATQRLSFVSPAIRERLMEDLQKEGVKYRIGDVLVRDVGVGTGIELPPLDASRRRDEQRLLMLLSQAHERNDEVGFHEILREYVATHAVRPGEEEEDAILDEAEEATFLDAIEGDEEEGGHYYSSRVMMRRPWETGSSGTGGGDASLATA